MTYKISILLPTFNGQAFLRQTLESIANQTAESLEVIVCDDKSTDCTRDIVADWITRQDMDIRFIENETNIGVGENIKQAARIARGDYLIMCGQDDLWAPDLLENLAKRLDNDRQISACFSAVTVINEKGREIVFSPFRNHWARLPQMELLQRLFFGNRLCAASALFRRDFFDVAYLGLQNDSLQDWACWLHMLCRGPFGYEAATKCLYRRHAKNQSRNGKAAQRHRRDTQNTLTALLKSTELNALLDQQSVQDESRFWRKLRPLLLRQCHFTPMQVSQAIEARCRHRFQLATVLADTNIGKLARVEHMAYRIWFAARRIGAATANRLPRG